MADSAAGRQYLFCAPGTPSGAADGSDEFYTCDAQDHFLGLLVKSLPQDGTDLAPRNVAALHAWARAIRDHASQHAASLPEAPLSIGVRPDFGFQAAVPPTYNQM